MNSEKMKELKVEGYELMAQIQFLQVKLQENGQKIAEENAKPKKDAKPD